MFFGLIKNGVSSVSVRGSFSNEVIITVLFDDWCNCRVSLVNCVNHTNYNMPSVLIISLSFFHSQKHFTLTKRAIKNHLTKCQQDSKT